MYPNGTRRNLYFHEGSLLRAVGCGKGLQQSGYLHLRRTFLAKVRPRDGAVRPAIVQSRTAFGNAGLQCTAAVLEVEQPLGERALQLNLLGIFRTRKRVTGGEPSDRTVQARGELRCAGTKALAEDVSEDDLVFPLFHG